MAITVNNIQTSIDIAGDVGYTPANVENALLVCIYLYERSTGNALNSYSPVCNADATAMTTVAHRENGSLDPTPALGCATFYLASPGTSELVLLEQNLPVADGSAFISMTLGGVDLDNLQVASDTTDWDSGTSVQTDFTVAPANWCAVSGVAFQTASTELTCAGDNVTNYSAPASTGMTGDYATEIGTGAGAKTHTWTGGTSTIAVASTVAFAAAGAAVARPRSAPGRKYPIQMLVNGRVVTIRGPGDMARLEREARRQTMARQPSRTAEPGLRVKPRLPKVRVPKRGKVPIG